MIYRQYGQTGKQCSVIGFGGMRFNNPDDIDQCASVIYNGYLSGINYFDTAPFYCNDKSEEIFGVGIKAIKNAKMDKPFYISTKSSQSEPKKVRQDIESSLNRLGVDTIDFYHCWCILTLDEFRKRVKNGVLKEFEKLKSEGLIRHICVSTHLAGNEISTLLDEYPFDGILLGYNAMNFAYREQGIQSASSKDLGVVVMNPLGGGIIPQNPDKFDFIRTTNNETVAQAALRFLINDPRITVALVGFSNQKELDEAISAVDGFNPISQKQIERIKSELKKNFDQLCTTCRYCDKCPQHIPIHKLMESYNYKILQNNPQASVNRMRWHWGLNLETSNIENCTDCGLCEKLCTQKLPIRKRLKELLQDFKSQIK